MSREIITTNCLINLWITNLFPSEGEHIYTHFFVVSISVPIIHYYIYIQYIYIYIYIYILYIYIYIYYIM